MKKIAAFLVVLATSGLIGAAPSVAPDTAGNRQKALIMLNRLAFGPRPGDVEKVLKMGLNAWIEQQLHPEGIPDRKVDARLGDYPTLSLSNREIAQRFYLPVLEARKERKKEAREGAEAPETAGREALVSENLPGANRADAMRIPPQNRPRRLIEELSAARILRAAESNRQLNEVMVDFWMNHFNVFANKGADRVLLTSYERDTIRPHIWGRFEDLLMATAKSPAMLFYLDNARSVADPEHRPARSMAFAARRGRPGPERDFSDARTMQLTPPPQQAARKGGLNENYAREIMELHTLGVDGGYTQKDVTELARVFTGWSMARPGEGEGFIFRARQHDAGSKRLLGVTFNPGGGMEEGERMIHLLSRNPRTAHHIAFQLCQRLVSDDPPAALVDRVAKRFLATDGDLRETVRAIVSSPELFDPTFYRGKMKSPFEFVISAVRASNATIENPLPLARELNKMGEPLYMAQPPTGYSDVSSTWISSGALLARLNFALNLAASRVPGTAVNLAKLIPTADASDPELAIDALSGVLTGSSLSATTRETIRARMTNPGPGGPQQTSALPTISGLILGSPEFQRQ
jgi:uncharacterized protein (DUF1800 family)